MVNYTYSANSTGWNISPDVPEVKCPPPAVSGAAAGTPSPIGAMSGDCSVLLDILQHSLGVDQFGRGEQYRNFFVADRGSEDHDVCSVAVRQELMALRPPSALMGGADLFHVTAAGRAYVADNSRKPLRKQKERVG